MYISSLHAFSLEKWSELYVPILQANLAEKNAEKPKETCRLFLLDRIFTILHVIFECIAEGATDSPLQNLRC